MYIAYGHLNPLLCTASLSSGIHRHLLFVHRSYNKVLITLTTHSVKNLTENDMILAAKIDGLPIMELLSIKKKYSDD